MKINKRRWRLSYFVVGALLIGVPGLGVRYFFHEDKASSQDTPEEEIATEVQVRTVHARGDSSFVMTVDRPANVEAYYRAPIEARVAGEIEWIKVALGSRVKKNDLLVKVRVPDLDADVEQKGAMVGQRKSEWDLAVKAVDTARANVEEKKTLLQLAQATTEYRQAYYNRQVRLRAENSIDQDVVDEAKKNLGVARADEEAAKAAKTKADAELVDATELVKVKQAAFEVAKAAHKAAQALDEYARVKAPWDGTVVNRHVDPGSFVQNASTGHPTPLLTLERTDVVTVVMRMPDNVAPFVQTGTEATLELDELPGVKIQGRVAHRPVAGDDRPRPHHAGGSGPVEQRPPASTTPSSPPITTETNPRRTPTSRTVCRPCWRSSRARMHCSAARRLLADMYGKMTLVLKSFGDSKLIPSVAILHEGGRELMYVVEQGKAHRVPIKVQVDDGHKAKVILLDDKGRVRGDLTGKEEVIVSNQEELSEGQPVTPALQENWQ